ncbi:MAG TPA: GAF domain-containing protein [Limnochordales bacterium]
MRGRRSIARYEREILWGLPLAVIGLAALHQAWLNVVLRHLSPEWHGLAQLAAYATTGVVVAWLGLRRLLDALAERERAEEELRRAYADLKEQQRRLVVLHEFGKRAASALDVQEVLTLAARVPVELVGARGTAAVSFDPETGRPSLEVTWNLSDAATARLRRVVEGGLVAEACRACQPLTANLNTGCPMLTGLGPLAAREGIGSVVCLPFSIGEDRVGVLATYLQAGEPPRPDRMHLLDVLAAEVAPALDRARLRARLSAAVYAGRELGRAPDDLHGLLDRALAILLEGWGAEVGAVLLRRGDPPTWEVEVQRHLGDMAGPAAALALDLARLAQERRRPVIIPRMRGRHGLRSVAAVPLEAEGEVLGVAIVGSTHDGQLALHHAEMLEALGAQLALAVRNAQLYHRLRETAVLEERYRLSREMHDTLAQTLGYLGLQASHALRLIQSGDTDQASEELRQMAEVLREAYLDVREAIEDLRASTDEGGGLEASLRRIVETFRQRTPIAAHLEVRGSVPEVPPAVHLQLLRIVQEALANVRKHSQATRVEVQVRADPGHLELSVADDGKGFHPASTQAPGHHGLVAMRERAQAIGARLTIATGPGRGTRVMLRLPVPCPAAPCQEPAAVTSPVRGGAPSDASHSGPDRR